MIMPRAGRMGKKERRKSAIERETPKDSGSAEGTTTRSLEIVEWQDANFQLDDQGFDGNYIVTTVGWTEEDGEWLKIVSEITPDAERAVTRVPLVNVKLRRRIALPGEIIRINSSELDSTISQLLTVSPSSTSQKSSGIPGVRCSCYGGEGKHDCCS